MIPDEWYLYNRRKKIKDREKKVMERQRQDWRDADRYMPRSTKDYWKPPEARVLPWSHQGTMALQRACFWTSSLHICKSINSSCFTLLVVICYSNSRKQMHYLMFHRNSICKDTVQSSLTPL